MPEPTRREPRIVPRVEEPNLEAASAPKQETPMNPEEIEYCRAKIKEWMPGDFERASRGMVRELENDPYLNPQEQKDRKIALIKGCLLRSTYDDQRAQDLFMKDSSNFWNMLNEEINLYLDSNPSAAE